MQKLKLWDATMIVMGSMIGSGIFIVSSDIMRQLGSGWWLLVVWLITGVITVSAALCYGELSSIFPKAGGQYTYLTEVFGKLTGFCTGGDYLRLYKPELLPRLLLLSVNLRLILFRSSMMPHPYFSRVALKLPGYRF